MFKHLVFVSLAMTGLAACGSGDKDMTVAEFTREVSQKECASVTSACLITETECLSTRLAYWSDLASTAAMAGRPFDPDNADDCLSKVKSVFGVLDDGLMGISAKDYREQKRICERVFHGPAEKNQPCAVSADCVDDLVCDKKGGNGEGFCGRRTEVAAGAQCANIGEYCATGYTCAVIGTGPVRQCVPRGAKGAVCADDDTCAETLRCMGGVCTDSEGPGRPCQVDTDCSTGFCEPFALLCSNDVRFAYGTPACQAYKSTSPVASSPDAGTGTSPDASTD